MKYGVRNALPATVSKVKEGDIMSQIECKLDKPVSISSILSTDSLKDMQLRPGDEILLLIKAIHVIPAKE